jgi:uncharacterized protein with PIN domain
VVGLRFVADGMLGKLTRWLRMLGYDVEYFNMLDDDELIEVAKSERRILLTRDLRLYQKASTKGVQAFLIEGKTRPEKLAELAKRYSLRLEIEAANSRCPQCNSNIREIQKEQVLDRIPQSTSRFYDRIPQSTSRFYDEFWECVNCGKVYWRGSHWKRINITLNRAKEIVGEFHTI